MYSLRLTVRRSSPLTPSPLPHHGTHDSLYGPISPIHLLLHITTTIIIIATNIIQWPCVC
ncbi:hypothetical protein E2C01_058128 [Portunus trituberculatus]|uniref:Uncharacterized protein n=1 Tax=Portunus trituberculatus TaxID=210409 RepID=A0A5B7H4G6_PORTR|nr:hypothetical protein [Portunus trituberculatus]